MRVLVTGGAGFIGSAVCRQLVRDHGTAVINVDKLTYAANPQSLAPIAHDTRYVFERVDICDRLALDLIFAKYMPTPCSTLRRRAMLTVPSLVPPNL